MAVHEQDDSKLRKVLGVVRFFVCVPYIGVQLLLAGIVALATGAEKAYNRWQKKREG